MASHSGCRRMPATLSALVGADPVPCRAIRLTDDSDRGCRECHLCSKEGSTIRGASDNGGGIMGFLKALLGDRAGGVRIIEMNAGEDLESEWILGRFSKMVVGESHHTADFMGAYSPVAWAGKKRQTAREVRDMVAVEMRRDPSNKFDANAVAVWCVGSFRVPGAWPAGYLSKEVAARVAPIVDSAGVSVWRSPAVLHGTVAKSDPTFGLFVLPSRLLTRGPDLSGLSQTLNLNFPLASERQVDFILSLLGAMPSPSGLVTELTARERAGMLSQVGSPPNWSDRKTWKRLDSHQASLAIDALQGKALWSA